MSLFKATTKHVGPVKILIEAMKDLLVETTMDAYQEPEIIEESSDESDDEASDTEKSKHVHKKAQPSKSGLKIMDMDVSQTVLVYLRLEANKFDEFYCDKPKISFGVNVPNMFKLIRSVDKDDNLTFSIDKRDRNYLGIRFDNMDRNTYTINKLKLMEPEDKHLAVPPTTFDAIITMASCDFHKLCRDMNGIANKVEINCTRDQVTFECEGDYAKRKTVFHREENNIGITWKRSNTPYIVHGTYALNMLVVFTKCTSLCDSVQLYMKNNYPLIVKYTVATLGKLMLCLMPNREDEDNDSDDEHYQDPDVKYLDGVDKDHSEKAPDDDSDSSENDFENDTDVVLPKKQGKKTKDPKMEDSSDKKKKKDKVGGKKKKNTSEESSESDSENDSKLLSKKSKKGKNKPKTKKEKNKSDDSDSESEDEKPKSKKKSSSKKSKSEDKKKPSKKIVVDSDSDSDSEDEKPKKKSSKKTKSKKKQSKKIVVDDSDSESEDGKPETNDSFTELLNKKSSKKTKSKDKKKPSKKIVDSDSESESEDEKPKSKKKTSSKKTKSKKKK
jgi:proliferating cell nuclear antigen